MTLPHVYIAGPYTRPDPVVNTNVAIQFGMDLYLDDLAYPVIPHLTMFVHFLCPQEDIEFWYKYDLHAMERCDALFRLPGESTGADREVAHAVSLGIPVFTDEQALENFLTDFLTDVGWA